ncbi:MAG: universal stress protein [Proteobacteria bacterium]|nr:universal stress protein [Pseudomonadota bacterium]
MTNSQNKRKILIPFDCSDQSIQTVNYASTMLSPESTGITLFMVEDDMPETFWDTEAKPEQSGKLEDINAWIKKQHQFFSDKLDEARVRFVANGFDPETVLIRKQKRMTGITRDIIREAKEGYDAIIVGRTGLSNQPGGGLGHVTSRLISKISDTTLVIVGSKPETSGIVVGFDGSSGAKRCVKMIRTFLNPENTKVNLCYVSRTLNVLKGSFDLFQSCLSMGFNEGSTHKSDYKGAINAEIEKAKDMLVNGGFSKANVDIRILQGYMSRSLAIIHEAADKGCGTIMLGRKGHSAVEEFVIGSVSEKVLHRACDQAVWIVS